MAEYIEREAAINSITKIISKSDMPEDWSKGMFAAMSTLYRIPAADVRPVVRGKWKVSAHKTYYDVSCSVCGINSFFQVDEKDSVSYANYCPNCGADMREEQDGR